jgi:CheY-like chemotaxis protein
MADQMKELVDWLRIIEEFAHGLYSRTSEFFAKDVHLSAFLDLLADDEAWHYHIMGSASDLIAEGKISVVSAIQLDPKTVGHVEKPLKDAHELLSAGTLSQRGIIESIVQAERSEWNILFLYAINTLKSSSKLFQHGASVIQSHQDRIEHFLSSHPDGLRYADAIRQLPTVWKPRFLVVDDEQPLREFLSDLLATRGVVETSHDGMDALKRTRAQFFDVIVSDIGMPKMSGLDFYREAVKEDPEVGSHFIFCSGEIASEHEQFLRERNLLYLRKPFKVNDLTESVDHLLQQSAEPSRISALALGVGPQNK